MTTFGGFDAADGTRLAYRRTGDGPPVVCVPGGPMMAAEYLGDLAGFAADRDLVLLDLRGTGSSALPADPASYRCDAQVDDLEALREHLGLGAIDLLAHSAGAAIAVRYAARHPERVRRLALLTPSPRVLDVPVTDADRREVAQLRSGEAWFGGAFAAFERIWAGDPTEQDWAAIAPFSYGRWDEAAIESHSREAELRNDAAAAGYYADGALDPAATRTALTALRAPALLVAGEFDVGLPPRRAAEYADLLPNAEVALLPDGGHFPWLDDPQWLRTTLAEFFA